MVQVFQVPRFTKRFAKLVKGNQYWLSSEALDHLVLNPPSAVESAQAIAVLKAYFKDIIGLRGKELLSVDELCLDDMEAIDSLLEEFQSERNSNETYPELNAYRDKKHPQYRRLFARRIFKMMAEVDELSNKQLNLYADNKDPLSSIKSDAIMQGRVGNCVFLASLASIVEFHPQIILKMIEDNNDDTYTVIFIGEKNHPVTVKKPNSIELAIFTRITEYGFWPAVIEKAWGQKMAEVSMTPNSVAQTNTACPQYWIEVYRMLTGQEGWVAWFDEMQSKSVKTALTESFKDKRSVTAWSRDGANDFTLHKNIVTNHAYSVLDWNQNTSTITLRNPWGGVHGGEPMDSSGSALDGKLDGVFTLSFDEFLDMFDAIHYELWSQVQEIKSSPEYEEYKSSGIPSIFSGIDCFCTRLMGLCLTLIAPCVAILCASALYVQYESLSWPIAQGEIISNDIKNETIATVEKASPEPLAFGHFYYHYKVNGKYCRGDFQVGFQESQFFNTPTYKPGQKVKVYYNPRFPEDNSCVSPGFKPISSSFLSFSTLVAILLFPYGAIKMFHRCKAPKIVS